MLKLAVACAIVLCLTFPAAAKHHHHGSANHSHRRHHSDCPPDRDDRQALKGPRPKRLTGYVQIAGLKFPFTSGGYGWSIPYGMFPINPDSVGSWGKRHHAIGIADGTIHDDQLGRDREGIEIHAADGDTHGCIGIHAQFDKLKKLILDMVDEGKTWLLVTPTKVVITHDLPPPLMGPIDYRVQYLDTFADLRIIVN